MWGIVVGLYRRGDFVWDRGNIFTRIWVERGWFDFIVLGVGDIVGYDRYIGG